MTNGSEVIKMQIPTAVRKQGEQSDRMIAEMRKQNDPNAASGTPDKSASTDKNQDKGQDSNSTAPGTEVKPEQKPVDVTETPEYKKLDDRFRQYKASTDQTIHNLRSDVAGQEALSKTIAEQNERINELEKNLTQAASKPVSSYDVLDDKEREDYDPEFVDVVSKISKANAKTELQSALDKIGSLESRLKDVNNGVESIRNDSAAKSQESFFQELDKLVPGWESIQANAGFPEFARQINELTGLTNQDLISKAVNDLDANRAALFYKKFAELNNVSVDTGQAISGLEKMIEPDSSGGGSNEPLGQSDQRKIPVSEINHFYNQVAIRAIRDKELIQRREAEFKLAQAEDRIVEG